MHNVALISGIGTSVLDSIGNTPLLRLDTVCADLPHAEIYAKAEWLNPGGSVKDRAAAAIVREALAGGHLDHGRRLLDSTSGNTGIAYAMLGAIHGFGVTLYMPANVSQERKRILKAYGAEVIETDAGEGSDGALLKARQALKASPDKYFYGDQYSNDANWRAHYHGTATEIWRQTQHRITHFVAVLGTSGTFVGTSRRLKELDPRIRCISVQPDSPFHGIEGAKHMATAIVPRIYDPSLADANVEVSTEDSYRMVKRLAREEGQLVGISAAAALVAGRRVAERAKFGERPVIVCIFPDNADKYLSERFWDQ